jgi:hypothetical protein
MTKGGYKSGKPRKLHSNGEQEQIMDLLRRCHAALSLLSQDKTLPNEIMTILKREQHSNELIAALTNAASRKKYPTNDDEHSYDQDDNDLTRPVPPKMVKCTRCDGRGTLAVTCDDCGGEGEVPEGSQ